MILKQCVLTLYGTPSEVVTVQNRVQRHAS